MGKRSRKKHSITTSLSRFLLLGFVCVVSCSTPQRVVLNGIPIVLNGADPPYVVIEEANFRAPLDLCAVASLADVERVKWACENNYDVNITDSNGDTPLHSIAMHSAKARRLLQWNDNREETVVSILVEHGANIHSVNKFGMNPLHTAAMANNSEVAKALLNRGANIESKAKIGDTPLFVAALEKGSFDVLKVLLEAGAQVDSTNNEIGATALHAAVAVSDLENVRLLLKYGADPTIKANTGITPFDIARSTRNTEMIGILSNTDLKEAGPVYAADKKSTEPWPDDWSERRALPIKTLIEKLTDLDWAVRSEAAYIIGIREETLAFEPLIVAMRDENPLVRYSAVGAIGTFKDTRALVPLIHALGDDYFMVKYTAARALGKLADNRAVEPLIKTLRDAYPTVRSFAAESLGNLGDKRAVEPLMNLLEDQDETVRFYATVALGKLGVGQK
ncbi:MAG: PBS lyase HEAT domain-containing protein [Nitrospirae bacterium]|nr:MAG: PBS lyase HEAT domain-containing protein [Nitrospirota bacterium]